MVEPTNSSRFRSERGSGTSDEAPSDVAAFRLTAESDARRSLVGRGLIYGSPVLAGVLTASYGLLLERFVPSGPVPSEVVMIFFNAALGAVGSAVGVVLLTGRVGLRVAGAFAYGVLALFIYGFTCAALMLLAH